MMRLAFTFRAAPSAIACCRTLVRNAFAILLPSGLLLLYGCSHKQASLSGSAIDRVQVGDTIWYKGATVCTLHVTKRDGPSLEGISVSAKLPTGQTQTIRADTATLYPNATNDKSIIIAFDKAKMQTDSRIDVLDPAFTMTLHE